MNTLQYIQRKYDLDLTKRSPIEIPNIGRNQMAELFGELKFEYGVEVGVAHGKYSRILYDSIPTLRSLWGVDPYEPHRGYRDYTHQDTFDSLKTDAHQLLDGLPNYKFIEKYSSEAVKEFEDESLDFVYIDGDHCFEAVVADIAAWLPKIRQGGIISGDDYFRSRGNARIQVVEAVNGYTSAWQVHPWFLIGRGAKVPGEIRDSGRSWMWVK